MQIYEKLIYKIKTLIIHSIINKKIWNVYNGCIIFLALMLLSTIFDVMLVKNEVLYVATIDDCFLRLILEIADQLPLVSKKKKFENNCQSLSHIKLCFLLI